MLGGRGKGVQGWCAPIAESQRATKHELAVGLHDISGLDSKVWGRSLCLVLKPCSAKFHEMSKQKPFTVL